MLERGRQAASPTAAEVAAFVPCDLASLESVRATADQILAQCDGGLDLFLANSGIMALPTGLSSDGYELHFATNQLVHALLTQKLLPLLERTTDLSSTDGSDPPRVSVQIKILTRS